MTDWPPAWAQQQGNITSAQPSDHSSLDPASGFNLAQQPGSVAPPAYPSPDAHYLDLTNLLTNGSSEQAPLEVGLLASEASIDAPAGMKLAATNVEAECTAGETGISQPDGMDVCSAGSEPCRGLQDGLYTTACGGSGDAVATADVVMAPAASEPMPDGPLVANHPVSADRDGVEVASGDGVGGGAAEPTQHTSVEPSGFQPRNDAIQEEFLLSRVPEAAAAAAAAVAAVADSAATAGHASAAAAAAPEAAAPGNSTAAGSSAAGASASASSSAAVPAAVLLPESGAAAGGVAADSLTVELGQIMARCGGVSDTRFAGRLSALVESEERLGGRLTLLSVVQQSSSEVLRLFVQGSGLRSLEQWVMQFRDEGRHGALVKVICCLKMLPIDLTALKGSSIGQTVGKLRKHTNPPVRAAASELVDQWKGVVDRSVGRASEGRQGLKSKADTSAQEGPNKRPRKAAEQAGAGAAGKNAGGGEGASSAAAAPPQATSKLAVMDDDLFVSAGSGGASAAPAQHRLVGLTSFMGGVKKVHAVKLENLIPGRPGSLLGTTVAAGHSVPGGQTAAATAGAAGTGAAGASGDATAEDGGAGGLPSPSSSGGNGVSSPTGGGEAASGAGAEAGGSAAGDGTAAGSDLPKPGGNAAGGNGEIAPPASTPPSLLPLADGTSSATHPAAGGSGSGVGVPKPMTLPRLGTLAGPSTATVRLGSLRDGSLPTSGIARLGAAPGVGGGGVGGRAGAAASLPAAVAPGGPQSAHARAMAARARAPSPEPAPRKEKRKTVSWAGDDSLASYRLFKKDDPPQLAAADAVMTAEDEAAAAAVADPNGMASCPGSLLPPPGFQSAARREHASERMALIAQHQQEEQERQQELERWANMRPTVPWVEPPELYLGSMSPQHLPALGEESVERDVQARLRQHTPRVVYYSLSQVPPFPAEAPPEPEPDPFRVRHIPLNVPGVGPAGIATGLPPPAVGMVTAGLYGSGQPPAAAGAAPPHLGGLPPPPYGGQLPPPPMPGMQPPQQALQPGQPQAPPGAVVPPQPGAVSLTLPPDLVASLPALINTLSQQQPQQGPPQQPGQVPPVPGPGPAPGQGPPPPPHALQHPHSHPHPHPHQLPHPHARMVGGPGAPQPGPPPHMQPHGGGPMVGPPGGPMRPMEYGMPQSHPGMGPGPGPGQGHPGSGPAGMPPGPGRPGSRFEPGPASGPGPGQGPGPGIVPPPPPRKDGQPTLMRPRRGDEPPGPGPGPGPGQGMPLGPPHPHPHGHPHLMGPGMRHPSGPLHGQPHGHGHGMQGGGPPHGMGPPGPGSGSGPGGWAAPSGPGGGGGPSGVPPPPGHGPGPSGKVCAYFNTPGGCRNGDACRFLHIHSQDGGMPYDSGPFPGSGSRSGMGMGRPGGGPPPGMPGGARRR